MRAHAHNPTIFEQEATENRGFLRCLCYLLFKKLKTLVRFSRQHLPWRLGVLAVRYYHNHNKLNQDQAFSHNSSYGRGKQALRTAEARHGWG
jgi:hypothetical protein